ncbi:MAG: type II toxin-antitoxin system death-on-curing family toxin [Candidatus Lambdaproteobacteria bacterium]|nr:type II toxin-antitoxin system death-on-curing family toxin [Candidatus Lambdaproteobacteria bacterium]
MAAAYFFHICRNHAFVDGNKCTALAATEVFQRLNGHILKASDEELETLTRGIADGTLSKDDATLLFRRHTGLA